MQLYKWGIELLHNEQYEDGGHGLLLAKLTGLKRLAIEPAIGIGYGLIRSKQTPDLYGHLSLGLLRISWHKD